MMLGEISILLPSLPCTSHYHAFQTERENNSRDHRIMSGPFKERNLVYKRGILCMLGLMRPRIRISLDIVWQIVLFHLLWKANFSEFFEIGRSRVNKFSFRTILFLCPDFLQLCAHRVPQSFPGQSVIEETNFNWFLKRCLRSNEENTKITYFTYVPIAVPLIILFPVASPFHFPLVSLSSSYFGCSGCLQLTWNKSNSSSLQISPLLPYFLQQRKHSKLIDEFHCWIKLRFSSPHS